MFKVYGVRVSYGEDGVSAERREYGVYASYAEAMRAGCELTWSGEADSYEVLYTNLTRQNSKLIV